MEKVVIPPTGCKLYTGMTKRSPCDVDWLLHIEFATHFPANFSSTYIGCNFKTLSFSTINHLLASAGG